MPLTTGTRLGPYEVLSLLGTGGMGDVYQARDGRLNRTVALKVLPPELVANDERRRRFVQEAQLASALQHPHIVTIFDIGSADGADYLAMELVKGRTLDAVIPQRGLRLTDALRYAVQITDALAAAHAAGIVHRDLKPGNIMVTEHGQIKILDFGLATLTESVPVAAADATYTQAPIVETGVGTIVGTVAYMSPEQAEGQKVDARSDIFSFGAILYEMLSGQRAFKANSTPGTLAAVINLEPPALASVVPNVPQPVERLVSRCLRKDVTRRAQHASDIKLTLEELQEDSSNPSVSGVAAPAAASRARSRSGAVAVGGLVAVLAIAGAIAAWWPRSRPAAPTAFVPTPLTSLPGSEYFPSFSPDGSQVTFTWVREDAASQDVYVQIVGETGTPSRLTNDEKGHGAPSWSPDGKSIALWHGAVSGGIPVELRLVLVSPLGGAERPLLEWTGIPRRISWSPDGQWLAVSPASFRVLRDKGITFVSPTTGERVEWAAIDPSYAGSNDPAFSPDGRRIAFIQSRDEFSADVYVADVAAGGRPGGSPTLIANAGHSARLPVWTADGAHLLVIDGAPTSNGGVVRVRVDGSEPAERLSGLEHASSLALSRDGGRLAIGRGGINADLWRIDLKDPSASGAIARSTLLEEGADYSPDGKRLAFSSNRLGAREIWVADATGENAIPLTRFGGPVPGSAKWSPDGHEIAFDARPEGNADIFVVPAAGGAVRQLTKSPADDGRPVWSRDGRAIYFTSTRGGRSEIWRMGADGSGAAKVIDAEGLWLAASRDNDWLYYRGNTLPFVIRRVRGDGTGDSVFVPEEARVFATTTSGLWFVSRLAKPGERVTANLRVLRFADNTIHDVAHLDFLPMVVGMSVSPDERYALVTKPDISGTDLLIVNDFR